MKKNNPLIPTLFKKEVSKTAELNLWNRNTISKGRTSIGLSH